MTFDDIAESPVALDRDFFFRLPKTDLHVHLDGSVRIETLLSVTMSPSNLICTNAI